MIFYSDWRSRVTAALMPLLIFSVLLLLALSISRLLLVAWQWERVEAANMVSAVFTQGLRFDIVLLGMLTVPLVLLFPILASNDRLIPLWKSLLRLYLPAVLLVAIFMELSTPSFIEQFDSRPNILFAEYLDHPKEVFATLWAAYRLPLAVAAAVITGLAAVFIRKFSRLTAAVRPIGIVPALVLAPLLLIACTAMIRSTLDHRPVNPSTVALSSDPLANDLALNSAYTLLYALYETRHEDDGGVRYGDMEGERVVSLVRNEMGIDSWEFTSDALPTLHLQQPSNRNGRPLNLVIIVEESLGAEFVGSLGGADLTSNLDRYSDSGLWLKNLYATGIRSVRGLEAIVSGFTPTSARSVVKLPNSQRNFFTLAGLLSRKGFETSFIYGGEAQFDNMRRFFANNGFEHIIDEKDYESPEFTGSWGVSDEDLFERAHREFQAYGDKPFFSLVFTSSNHSPFQFPDGRIDLVDAEKNTVNNAVKYADYALGQFLDKAQDSDYWDDTVFLIVADHNSRVYGSELVPVERFHIPGLILGGSVQPGEIDTIASQIDLAPTLLSMIGIESEHPMIGHDLTQARNTQVPGRAIMQFNATQAYLEGDRLAVLQKDQPVKQFRYQDGRLVESEGIDPLLTQKALAHANWSSMAYRQSLYRLPEFSSATIGQLSRQGRNKGRH